MTKQKPGCLIVLSGPSGVGKGTVLRRFMAISGSNCALSVSATTRAPRAGERDGKDYFFMPEDKFRALAASGGMLEWAEYGGNLYGTPRDYVENRLAEGKNVILEIDVRGAMDVRRQRPDATLVFIAPPSWAELRLRLSGRGTETAQSLARRLAIAGQELSRAEQYDYILVNDDIDRCADALEAVIAAVGWSAANMSEFIREVRADI